MTIVIDLDDVFEGFGADRILERFEDEELVEELEDRGYICIQGEDFNDTIFDQLDDYLFNSDIETIKAVYDKVQYHYDRIKDK